MHSDVMTVSPARGPRTRRFPAPWQVEETPGGYKVLDATG
jgi:hypothetical protein